MIKTDFMSLYEELSVLNESKADIDNFINKFGEDTYELFKKSNQRLKNKGISTDLTYHIKHTDKKDLDAILLNLQNRAITKDDNLTELAGDYEYLGTGKGYKVYKINDVIASINFGAGTGWCISGRYGHYGEKNYTPTRETAEEHWDSYAERGVKFYFFIGTNSKVALALYPRILNPNIVIGNVLINKTNCEIYNEQDDLDYGLLDSLPVDLINKHIIFEGIPAENGFVIKDDVLFKCDCNLENVAIPDGITKIADYAFSSCTKLKTVAIPNSIKYIGDGVFSGCSSLTSIVIPESVTSIEDSTFYGCYRLTSITLPNSVTSIGDWAFGECRSLTSITIGSGVKSIGDDAFDGCTNLKNIVVDKNNPSYKVVDGHLYDKNNKMII